MNLAVWGWNFMMQLNVVESYVYITDDDFTCYVQLEFAGLPEYVSPIDG